MLALDLTRTRALIDLAFAGPRDVFNTGDLRVLRAARELVDRRVPRARIVEALTQLQRYQAPPAAGSLPASSDCPDATQGGPQAAFDFALATPPTQLRGPGMVRNAEKLFTTAVQLEERDPGQAVDAYTEAVAANPLHADAHVNLGRMLHQRGRLREAEAHYIAALVSRPGDVTALFNLAVVLEDLGRIDEAIARYHEAIELDPGCVDAYYNLARLYERKGEKMAAIRHLSDYRRLTRQP